MPILAVLLRILAGIGLLLLAALPLAWKTQAALGATLVVVAFWLNRRSRGNVVTIALALMSMFCTVRYAWWRGYQTYAYFAANGSDAITPDLIFVVLLLAAEAYAVVILLLGYFQIVRPLRRTPVPLSDAPESWPEVAVFIPTYNEPLDVVRPTILAAMQMDWPQDRFRVYVLDDGRRPEFRQFAEECGAGYITRNNNAHAKAGNINHALGITTGELVAIFDSDHIPARSFLQLTVGSFLKDKKLGMVQTPHHFYSPDPFERNLDIFRKVPNEGALFYGLVQDGNDFWNACFFCGSCAVLRRDALNGIGGVAVETVTEDAHTSLRMQRQGWNTAYINIPQAGGLATATLSDHIGQRIRWARGMVQIFRIDNPLLGRGLSLAQRLCYLNSLIHFLYGLPRLIFLTAPLVYLILGRSNLYGYLLAILAYAGPHLVMATVANSRIQGRFRFSFWNEVYETVLAPYILFPTLLALVNPKWGKFNVTSKDRRLDNAYFDWKVARPFLVLLALNLIGVGMAVPQIAAAGRISGTLFINLLWAGCNSLMLGAALAIASEQRQRRVSVRVGVRLPVTVSLSTGETIRAETIDVSNSGAALLLPAAAELSPGLGAEISFPSLEHVCSFPVRVVHNGVKRLGLQFSGLALPQQIALTSIVYARADSWIRWSEGRADDRPLRSLGMIFRVALGGFGSVFRALTAKPEGAPVPRRQPVFPLIAIGIAILLFFAWRAPAAQTAPTFHDVRDLPSLGAKQPIVLHGVDGRSNIYFGIPVTKVVTDARVMLKYHIAPSLSPQTSQLEILLNGSSVSSVPLAAAGGAIPISLPADLLTSDNALTFHILGHCVSTCDANAAAGLWTQIDLSTEIHLSGSQLTLANDLRLLPAPFFDGSIQRTVELPIAFTQQPDAALLEAAGVVASYFGKIADYRGIRFPVSIGRIPTGNVVLLATGPGPSVAMEDNPNDPFGKLLRVSGSTPEQILTAARALALGELPATGERADVSAFRVPARRSPYDAPRWLNPERPAGLGEGARAEQLRVYGNGAVNLYFRMPPDLDLKDRTSVPLHLNYQVTGLPAGAKAEMKIRLNGVPVAVKQFTVVPASDVQRKTVALPIPAIYANNTLTVEFVFEATGAAIQPQVTVLRNSGLDLSGVPHFAEMPRLELFANAGFPFTRLADLSETAVVLPANPNVDQLSLYLDLLGFFGAQTGYPGLRVAVVDPETAAHSPGKDLLVIGTAADQPLLSTWSTQMAVRVDTTPMRAGQPPSGLHSLWRMPWTLWGKERRRLEDLLGGETPSESTIQAFTSPADANRSVVVLTTTDPNAIEPLLNVLASGGNPADVYGTASVFSGGRFHSFSLRDHTYRLGSLDWLQTINYWLAQYVWAIPVLIPLLALYLSAGFEQWLERRAMARLQS